MTEARQALDKAMSEKTLQQTIIYAARMRGFKVYHTFDSRRSEYGFPDLICLKGAVMLVIECKRQSGKVSVYQDEWLDAFKVFADAIAGHPVAVLIVQTVRPSDLDGILEMIRFYADWKERKTA